MNKFYFFMKNNKAVTLYLIGGILFSLFLLFALKFYEKVIFNSNWRDLCLAFFDFNIILL